MTKMTTLYKTIEQPKYAWRVELAANVVWYREEGQQPNAFHRMMHRLFFGFKWERINEEEIDD